MDRRFWREFNLPLLICVLVLLGLGMLSVYSAMLNAVTGEGVPLRTLFPRHVINMGVGIILMLGAMLVDYRLLSSLTRPLYIIVIVVLGVVLIVGRISEGAQSWIEVGSRTIQPSEPAKLIMILVLAAYWAHFEAQRTTWGVQFGGLLLMAIPILLVLIQPDFGTAMVFGSIWLAMAWSAGLRWPQLLGLAVLTLPLLLVGWYYVFDPEQRSRFSTFYYLIVNPAQVDPNEGYNVIQSLNAISSGGWFGAGLTHGALSQGNYVPVQYSDFIFAVIGEELGFVGGVVILIFQGLLLWQVLSIANRAYDLFGRLVAIGVFGMMLCHLVVNVGMTMSITPVTGIPLPFISYGGSFMLTSLVTIGLLESVAMRWRRISFA